MDIHEAKARVRRELVEHLTTALKEVGSYADTYVESVLTNPRCTQIPKPRGLHPNLAAMVRDIALDALAAEPVVLSGSSATVDA
jgi:hypothetical protein